MGGGVARARRRLGRAFGRCPAKLDAIVRIVRDLETSAASHEVAQRELLRLAVGPEVLDRAGGERVVELVLEPRDRGLERRTGREPEALRRAADRCRKAEYGVERDEQAEVA